MLFWRLTHTALKAPVNARIESIQGAAGAYAVLAKLCTNCPRIALGHLMLDAAQASALSGGRGYVAVAGASGELRGRIVRVPPSTPTLLSFGRTGGNIRSFSVTVTSDGVVQVSGPGWIVRTGKVSLPIRDALVKLAQAEGFFSMPTRIQCSGVPPDMASRFVTISTAAARRTVTAHGSCNQPFEELYAVLIAALLGQTITD